MLGAALAVALTALPMAFAFWTGSYYDIGSGIAVGALGLPVLLVGLWGAREAWRARQALNEPA